jgi:hypothetical protein
MPGLIEAPVVAGENAAALGRIGEPGVAMALWRRQPPAFCGWLGAVDAERLPAARFEVFADGVAAALAEAARPLPDGQPRAALVADAAALARAFAEAAGAPRLRVRFERVATDACRRFHVDRVRARLICTWRGPGTEYRIGEAGPVAALGLGQPAIFRGALWPADDGAEALLHRSPPVEAAGLVRFTLVVDADDDAWDA